MFRFTIRDVLWLTVVVGIGLAWFRQSQRWSRATEAMRLGHEQAIADSPFPKHDFSREPTGEAADHFRLWLEDQTIDMLRRTIGDAEGIKTAIFLFVNRAYEAKMPDREIGG